MPRLHGGKQEKQRARSKMAARRSGPPPQEKSRSLSARREETVEVTEPVVDALESKAASTTKTNSKQKKRSRSQSKSRKRSTSRTRQEQAVVAAAIDSEDDESEGEEEIEEEGDIPAPLAGVPELDVASRALFDEYVECVRISSPVDPEVVASRVRHDRVVLTADSTPAEYWKRADY
ncbi:hypothetical protein JG688_00001293 [Phytophthora aleatoria]|uniref:Uncharacterized protein n=1 Tax=Phytophthora aleatoria TaxID=2496075 RepID=A0A8J5IXU4_9STRA|nr:hypothetical protein GQ600_13267 [Phytophthora cactorum]KAG6976494.1 hypothetical protein JG688_00001293 [Phytophthora aleatoria]